MDRSNGTYINLCELGWRGPGAGAGLYLATAESSSDGTTAGVREGHVPFFWFCAVPPPPIMISCDAVAQVRDGADSYRYEKASLLEADN